MKKKIMFSAGEVSGDLQASFLVKELKLQLGDEVELFGIGGEKMQNAGMDVLHNITSLSSVGFVEPISFVTKKIRVGYNVKSILKNRDIDLLVLVDNQGFNIPLAGWAKKYDIKTAYYFPPPVAIWGRWNIKKLKKNIDLLICTFYDDYKLYLEGGTNAIYCGHPFIDIVKINSNANKVKLKLGLNSDKLIGLLPGSRKQEVIKFLRVQLDAARLINNVRQSSFLVPVSNLVYRDYIEDVVKDYPDLNVTITSKDYYDYINACDLLILSSGSATLEAAILGIPMIIIYRVSPITFSIGKRLANIKHVGLPNLILKDDVVPELLQKDMEPSIIFKEAMKFLSNEEYSNKVSQKLLAIKDSLGNKGVIKRITNKIVEELL